MIGVGIHGVTNELNDADLDVLAAVAKDYRAGRRTSPGDSGSPVVVAGQIISGIEALLICRELWSYDYVAFRC